MKYILLIICIAYLITLKPIKLNKLDTIRNQTIKVEVSGHLSNPGVFELNNYTRVEELLSQLELYDDSDTSHLSLNKTLVNQDVVVIRKIADIKMISINSATIEELATLPGIKEKMAQRIIDYRNEHGSFQTLEQLKEVKGIGDKLFQKLVNYITL